MTDKVFVLKYRTVDTDGFPVFHTHGVYKTFDGRKRAAESLYTEHWKRVYKNYKHFECFKLEFEEYELQD